MNNFNNLNKKITKSEEKQTPYLFNSEKKLNSSNKNFSNFKQNTSKPKNLEEDERKNLNELSAKNNFMQNNQKNPWTFSISEMSPTLNNYNNIHLSNLDDKFFQTPQKNSNFHANINYYDSNFLYRDNFLQESPLHLRNIDFKSNIRLDNSSSKKLNFFHDSSRISKRNLASEFENVNTTTYPEQVNNNNYNNPHSINININNNINDNNENFPKRFFNNFLSNSNLHPNSLKINENLQYPPRNNNLYINSDEESINVIKPKFDFAGKNKKIIPEKTVNNNQENYNKEKSENPKNKLNSLLEKFSLNEESKTNAKDFISIEKKHDQIKSNNISNNEISFIKTSENLTPKIKQKKSLRKKYKKKNNNSLGKTINLNVMATTSKCTCTKTKCIKKYCECFSSGRFCDGCGCDDGCCENVPRNTELKYLRESLSTIKKEEDDKEKIICNCTHSECQKKYCKCFKAGKKCSSECRCINCNNCLKLKDKKNKKSKSKRKFSTENKSRLNSFVNRQLNFNDSSNENNFDNLRIFDQRKFVVYNLSLLIKGEEISVKESEYKNENSKKYIEISNFDDLTAKENMNDSNFIKEKNEEIKLNEIKENIYSENEEIELNEKIEDTKNPKNQKIEEKINLKEKEIPQKTKSDTKKIISRRSNRVKSNNCTNISNIFFEKNEKQKIAERENNEKKPNFNPLIHSQEFVLNSNGSIVKKDIHYFKFEEYLNSGTSKKKQKNSENFDDENFNIDNNYESEIYNSNSKENSKKKIQKIMETPKLCEKKRKRNTTNSKSRMNTDDIYIKTNSTMNQTPNFVRENNRMKKMDLDSNNIVKNLQSEL